MKTKQIVEGSTKLIVPDIEGIPEEGDVFYNPKMTTNRSVSSFLLKVIYEKKKNARIADVMCGLGARAVRYATEGYGFEVLANDVQPSAVKMCEENAKLNNVKVTASICEANVFMMAHKYNKFDFVDIDPFGSPAPFLNSAMHCIDPVGGVLGMTATDLGTLAGVYPKACFRKYFTISDRNSFMHELGLRNMIVAAAREACKFDLAVKPLFSYNHIHYNRAFIQTIGGRKTTNRDFRNMGYIKYCDKCERREMIPLFEDYDVKCECGEKAQIFGITWIGKLADPLLVENANRMIEGSGLEKEAAKFIPKNESEYDVETPYYQVARLTSIYKKECKKLDAVIAELRENGYKAYGTHFEGQAIKTNAPYSDLVKALFKK